MESQGLCGPQKLRFVILRHQRTADTHWDLLLELSHEGLLVTFQVHLPPQQWGPDLPAIRLPDHRRIYLDYEGEISGGRGHVTRVDAGTVEILELGDRWRVRLEGGLVRGEFVLG